MNNYSANELCAAALISFTFFWNKAIQTIQDVLMRHSNIFVFIIVLCAFITIIVECED